MTYHTIETTSLTNEADSNLPKEESKSSHRTWLGVVAAALLLGGGTMLASSSSLSSSSNINGTIRSNSVEGSLVDVGDCPTTAGSTYLQTVSDPPKPENRMCKPCCYDSMTKCKSKGATSCYPGAIPNSQCCSYPAKRFYQPFSDDKEVECCHTF